MITRGQKRPCRNAGEIELVFRAPRRNDVRLLLLMDVGGTMDPYYEPVSRLLSGGLSACPTCGCILYLPEELHEALTPSPKR